MEEDVLGVEPAALGPVCEGMAPLRDFSHLAAAKHCIGSVDSSAMYTFGMGVRGADKEGALQPHEPLNMGDQLDPLEGKLDGIVRQLKDISEKVWLLRYSSFRSFRFFELPT